MTDREARSAAHDRFYNAVTLRAAAAILRREAEKDTTPSQNDKAELRIAAAVCEGVANRGS